MKFIKIGYVTFLIFFQSSLFAATSEEEGLNYLAIQSSSRDITKKECSLPEADPLSLAKSGVPASYNFPTVRNAKIFEKMREFSNNLEESFYASSNSTDSIPDAIEPHRSIPIQPKSTEKSSQKIVLESDSEEPTHDFRPKIGRKIPVGLGHGYIPPKRKQPPKIKHESSPVVNPSRLKVSGDFLYYEGDNTDL